MNKDNNEKNHSKDDNNSEFNTIKIQNLTKPRIKSIIPKFIIKKNQQK